MKYRFLITILLGLIGAQGLSFAQGTVPPSSNATNSSQKTQDGQDTTNDGTAVADKGVIFNLPAGSWWPIPEDRSLAPTTMNKLQEQLDTSKKVTVIFSSNGGSSPVIDLLEGAYHDFIPQWDDIQVIEKPHLLTDPNAYGAPQKFAEIYQATDMKTHAVFRIEVVVASQWGQRGSRGVLYIFTPLNRYYENRFFIQSIRDALSVDPSTQNTANSQPSQTSGK